MQLRHLIISIFLLPALIGACSSGSDCEHAADCDDSNVCTEDRCKLGVCSHLVTPGCCQSDQDCSGGMACDMQKHICATSLGEPCSQASDCPGSSCLDEIQSGFAGGFCSQPCESPVDCESQACIGTFMGTNTCLTSCKTNADCRAGYFCLPVAAEAAACFPHCTSAAECTSVGACNMWMGLCTAQTPGADNGSACTSDDDCKGFCLRDNPDFPGPPGGICFSVCSAESPACPLDNEACVYILSPIFPGLLACLPVHNPAEGCRPGYVPLLGIDVGNEQVVAVCQPACRAGDCQSGNCNEFSGLCDDDRGPLAADTGQPCTTHANCKGLCLSFWPEGYCTSPCDFADPQCPGDDVCLHLGVQTSCGAACQIDQDCRPGYFCHETFKGCVAP